MLIDVTAELPTVAVAVASLPTAPVKPTKVQYLSTQSSIYVTWEKPNDSQPITGYQLFMNDQLGGKSTIVYDGRRNPNLMSFNAANLQTGKAFGFSVLAFNFNGAGELSEEAVFKTCTAPSGQTAPIVQHVDEINISIQWVPPKNDGGCPI